MGQIKYMYDERSGQYAGEQPPPDTRCPVFSASDARVEGFFLVLKKKPSNADAGLMRGFFQGGFFFSGRDSTGGLLY